MYKYKVNGTCTAVCNNSGNPCINRQARHTSFLNRNQAMTKVFSLHSGMFAMCDINMRDLMDGDA